MKRKIDNIQDEMAQIQLVHSDKVTELESFLREKDDMNKKLEDELSSEKILKEHLEEQRKSLLKTYEEEKSAWTEQRAKIERKLQTQVGLFKERVPFDAFGKASLTMLNAVKSDCKTREKQVKIVQTLKDILDPTSAHSIAQGFETFLKALKNLSDGSMPVFHEFGQDGGDDLGDVGTPYSTNDLMRQSVKQFTIYLERVSPLN